MEERWSDFRVRRGADGDSSASFDATWTVRETRLSSSTDCTSTGEATGSGLYPWFLFELNPFDEMSYILYSGGHGGGPDATGVMTVNCRGQPPYSFEYQVQASGLPAAFFPMQGVLDDFSQEELDSMPQETLDLMLELDAMLKQGTNMPALAITGSIDPAKPHIIRGSATEEIDGGEVTVTWNLIRPLACDDTEGDERLAREADRLRKAQAGDATPELDTQDAAQATYSGPPLTAADVRSALTGAVASAEQIALRDANGNDAAGLQQFAVRLSGTGQPLPSLAYVQSLIDTTCVEEGSFEAARTMLVGSVQWVENKFRVNVRTVDVETGVITDSVSVQGTGGSDQLPAAVQRSFSQFLRRSP